MRFSRRTSSAWIWRRRMPPAFPSDALGAAAAAGAALRAQVALRRGLLHGAPQLLEDAADARGDAHGDLAGAAAGRARHGHAHGGEGRRVPRVGRRRLPGGAVVRADLARGRRPRRRAARLEVDDALRAAAGVADEGVVAHLRAAAGRVVAHQLVRLPVRGGHPEAQQGALQLLRAQLAGRAAVAEEDCLAEVREDGAALLPRQVLAARGLSCARGASLALQCSR